MDFKLFQDKGVFLLQMNGREEAGCFPIALGEFKDKELERDFFNDEISSALKYIRPLIMVMGVLFFLFIVPDYFLIQNKGVFNAILITRAVFLIMVILLYLGITRMKNYAVLANWFTAYEIVVSLSFLYIFYIYESPDFLIQSFGVILIILIVFLVPNRWIYMVFVSVGLSLSFFVFAAYHLNNVRFSEISAAVVYTALVIILSSVSSYRINYYKRVQYIYSRELMMMSVTDVLTGIFNRAKFNEELEKWIALSKRYNSPLSLVIFDLDDLKIINDNYGHLAGDEILVGLTKIVLKVIRETDIFVRWGGDEFMILLPNTQEQQAVQLTERIRKSISDHVFDKVGQVNCSFGVVTLNESDDINTFLHRVDRMLYAAKNAGKNVVMSRNYPESIYQ